MQVTDRLVATQVECRQVGKEKVPLNNAEDKGGRDFESQHEGPFASSLKWREQTAVS